MFCFQPSRSFGLSAFTLCFIISTKEYTRPLLLVNNLEFPMLLITFTKRSFLIIQSLMNFIVFDYNISFNNFKLTNSEV